MVYEEAVKQLIPAFFVAFPRDDQAAGNWLGASTDKIGDDPLLFKRKWRPE